MRKQDALNVQFVDVRARRFVHMPIAYATGSTPKVSSYNGHIDSCGRTASNGPTQLQADKMNG